MLSLAISPVYDQSCMQDKDIILPGNQQYKQSFALMNSLEHLSKTQQVSVICNDSAFWCCLKGLFSVAVKEHLTLI